MNKKNYNILIRAHTCRRDAAPAELLANILRKFGHSVIVASVRNFKNSLKSWRPDAVILFTPSNALSIREISPNTKVIFLEGECFQLSPEYCSEHFKKNKKLYDAIDLIQVCGEAQKTPFFDWVSNNSKNKLRVAGNLKLDLARFLPTDLIVSDSSINIGIVGRFPKLNHHGGLPAFLNLVSEMNLEYLTNMAKAFYGTFQVIQAILSKTDYNVSIRPHPNESLEYYEKLLQMHFSAEQRKRVEIDKSLDFSSWAAQQKVLVSPTSTSFLEASILGVPVINIDKICDTAKYNSDYAEVASEWQQGAIMPNDIEELVLLLQDDLKKIELSQALKTQLIDNANWNCKVPASLIASKQIIDFLNKEYKAVFYRWPKWLVELKDKISFYRVMKKTPMHANFNYKVGYHKLPKHFDKMTDIIMGYDKDVKSSSN